MDKGEINTILLKLRLSEATLAAELGVTRKAVLRWTSGKAAIPDAVAQWLRDRQGATEEQRRAQDLERKTARMTEIMEEE